MEAVERLTEVGMKDDDRVHAINAFEEGLRASYDDMVNTHPGVINLLTDWHQDPQIFHGLGGRDLTPSQYQYRLSLVVTVCYRSLGAEGFAHLALRAPIPMVVQGFHIYRLLQEAINPLATEVFTTFFITNLVKQVALHTHPTKPFDSLSILVNNMGLDDTTKQALLERGEDIFHPMECPVIH